MYSVILMTCMSVSPDSASFGNHVLGRSGRSGCGGYQATATSTYKESYSGCAGQSGGLLHRLRERRESRSGCNGNYGRSYEESYHYKIKEHGYPSAPTSTPPPPPANVMPQSHISINGLDQVNNLRAQVGKPPYKYHEGLTLAAQRCAEFRARFCIRGHVSSRGLSDYSFLPPGCPLPKATGANFDNMSANFNACCVNRKKDNYQYAGCASAQDRYGRWYHSIFVL